MSFFGYSKLSLDQARIFVINCYMGVLRRYPERQILEKDSLDISLGKKTCAEFLSGIIYSTEFRSIGGPVDFFDLTKSYADLEIKNKNKSGAIKNIIYFGFSSNRPIGGMKVIFHHANLLNSFSDIGITAQVFFPETSDFNITWMDMNFDVKRDHSFNATQDFIIIPEVWAWHYGRMFKEAGVRYGVFVQNGYLIFHELGAPDMQKLIELKGVYNNAAMILSISDDVTKCIQSSFPRAANNIIQLTASIDTNLFTDRNDKKNIISYMPRKLPSHSSWVVNFLKDKIPDNWNIVPIDNMTEKQVADALSFSKIFMSFSDQEGLGLPPLEAAISGNKVIGYTGQAGKEYWDGQIFCEVECGNLLKFSEAVIEETERLNNLPASSVYPEFPKQVKFLSERYSFKREAEALRKLITKISQL